MSKKKILLVDDSKVVLMNEEMLLKGTGRYELTQASDGAEALALAASEFPDLILMDIVMPNMDGFASTRAIRENPETRHIPIILVSTRGEPNNVELGYECGCNDYVTKPINKAELLEKIENLLD